MIDIEARALDARRRPRRKRAPDPVRRVEGAVHTVVDAGQLAYWLDYMGWCWHYGAPRALEGAYRQIAGTR